MNRAIVKINFDFFLIKFYKQLFLDELDVLVIFVLKYLLECNNKNITPEMISIKMNISISQVDQILLKLMNKKYIVYEKKNKNFTLKYLEDKLIQMYCIQINKENSLKFDNKSVAEIESIEDLFKQKIFRNLSNVEHSLVVNWVLDGFNYDDCKTALEIVEQRKNLTFRAVDDILNKKNN